jgi:hypothetical protein
LDQAYKRPDPLIYDQYYLMSMGLAVTWDNPDIQIFEPGPGSPHAVAAAVPSSSLHPDHLYRVRVRVWNGSYEAPAVGLPVELSYLSFGVGTTSHAVGMDVIDLGVKGASSQPAFAYIDWRTPTAPGHYCLQARLDWVDDANPNNNLGQDNVHVGVAHSAAVNRFLLVNHGSAERRFILEADTYQPPTPRPCDEEPRAKRPGTRLAESRGRWERTRREQGVGSFPLPEGWAVAIEPTELALWGGQEQEVTVSIEPPSGTSGAPVNVNAFILGEDGSRYLAGGVTLYVERS